MTTMDSLFEEIAALIRDTPVTSDLKVSDNDKLKMYGLYKQATVGKFCPETAPSRWQVVAWAKHQAWVECRDMSTEQAMLAYVELAASQPHWLGNKCQGKLNEWKEQQSNAANPDEHGSSDETKMAALVDERKQPSPESNNKNGTTVSGDHVDTERTDLSVTENSSSHPNTNSRWFEKLLGIQPLVPRGQLDISYRDLGFAAWQCLRRSHQPSTSHLERKIANLWGPDESSLVMTGLSVRSLLDLYLRATSHAPGSEIIMTPLIQIPGMMQVFQHHNLGVVPVDIPSASKVAVDVDAVRKAVMSKTVAIMVVHPFGMKSTTNKDMECLRDLAKEHKLHLLEDCAECFTGLGPDCYKGSAEADVSFFSFGTIKTATALGGGIAIIRRKQTADKMHRMHHSLYPQQRDYLRKVLWCILIRFIADHPLLYGMLFCLVSWAGRDFDKIVSCSTRTFVHPNTRASNDERQAMMRQLRRRPSAALLAVLSRRLEQSQRVCPSVPVRMEQCRYMTRLLENNLGICPVTAKTTFWLFPVHVESADAVSRHLREQGFDVSRGTSQLEGVTTSSKSCRRTEELMKGILYLPVANRRMSKTEIRRLAHALDAATIAAEDVMCKKCGARPRSSCRQRPRSRWSTTRLLFGIVLLDGLFFRWIPPSSWLVYRVVWPALGVLAAIFPIAVFAAVALRWTMADFYIESSNCFSRYLSLLFSKRHESTTRDYEECRTSPDGTPAGRQSKPLLGMEVLRIPDTKGVSPQRSVLLTGATGFIGRLLLRDLLLHREKLSIEGGVVVLCRSKRGRSALQRISSLLDDPMFSFLSPVEKRTLVKVFDGDVTKPNVGLSPDNITEICTRLDISHVIHCAATVSFTQTLEEAAVSNISSSLNLQSLTARLKLKSAKYVHISTAFVHGGMTGTECDPLPEKLHSLDGYDAAELYRSMVGSQFYAMTAMNDLQFPNTYTFSKCVCEHLLAREKRVRTIVIRPSIVGPAAQQPYEGWAGDKPSTLVAAACLYMAYQWNLWCFGNHTVPFVPVDVVSTFVIAEAFGADFGACDSPKRSCSSPATCSSDEDYERVSQYSDFSSSFSDVTGDSSTAEPDESRVPKANFRVRNLAWDSSSSDSAAFTWIEYAVAVTHLGAVYGYFARMTAYLGLFVTVRILPYMALNMASFAMLHRVLVQFPIEMIISLFNLWGCWAQPISRLSKLSAFLDLPLLFFPFMNSSFHFTSDLVAPDALDGKRYLFSCAVAAERFVRDVQSRQSRKDSNAASPKETVAPSKSNDTQADSPVLVIGGVAHKPTCGDIWWALTQPRGNFSVRLAGWIFRKILRASCAAVTIDVESFSPFIRELTSGGNRPHIVLAPNHRSFFDFILISYICFSLPELGVDVPFIAAADDFERLPFFGWFAAQANAFFLRRGRGKADPSLEETLTTMKTSIGDRSLCVEVFVEGSRSRDRRFLTPKTGLLRCLANSGGEHLIVPMSINYEKIPEQTMLSSEVESGNRSGLSSEGIFGWLQSVFSGTEHIGRIHVAAARPIRVRDAEATDFGALAKEIQRRQQEIVYVSGYHIHAASKALRLCSDTISRSLAAADCNFWPGYREHENCPSCAATPEPPNATSEQWTALLQFGHNLSSFFETSHPKWSKWLNDTRTTGSVSVEEDASECTTDLRKLIDSVGKFFDDADDDVDKALTELRTKGFDKPDHEHLIQYMRRETQDCPVLLLRAAASFRLGEESLLSSAARSSGSHGTQEDVPNLLVNASDVDFSDNDETLGFWGFRDSGFVLRAERNSGLSVVMKGTRYGICGKPLKKLIPFIENETKTRIDPFNESPFPPLTCRPMECDLAPEDVDCLKATMTKLSLSPSDRIRHGSGHTQEDMFLIRSGSIDKIRLPDAVVWPSSEEEVGSLVSLAKSKNWCLIPFGGGTNVSHATRCPTKAIEPRPILSVDMKLMDRILWVNEEDGLVHVEAGITGRALVEAMHQRGYTIGHEPDSIEFSTLGGWIATKASGMKRNKYGNIEDIVKSVRVVGSKGVLWRGKDEDEETSVHGRVSRGLDLVSVALGSEGCFGIITSAVIRMWPIPERQEYDSVVFADFAHGLRFCRDVARLGPNIPSSVRLLDNEHFRLGQALQGETSLVERGLTYLWKKMKPSFDTKSAVCATIVFEGTQSEVESQRSAIQSLAHRHGGTCVGARVGKSGYELTFAIAYLRDFAMTYNFLAESFETFAPWSKVDSIIKATKKRIKDEHRRRCLPGEPFVGSRVTQLYHEGACLYFYFCMSIRGVQHPSSIFAEIEHSARQEILDQGGSLNHHHGIGKVRADFAKKMDSDALRDFVAGVKKSIDPTNTFGVRNGALS